MQVMSTTLYYEHWASFYLLISSNTRLNLAGAKQMCEWLWGLQLECLQKVKGQPLVFMAHLSESKASMKICLSLASALFCHNYINFFLHLFQFSWGDDYGGIYFLGNKKIICLLVSCWCHHWRAVMLGT